MLATNDAEPYVAVLARTMWVASSALCEAFYKADNPPDLHWKRVPFFRFKRSRERLADFADERRELPGACLWRQRSAVVDVAEGTLVEKTVANRCR